MSTRHVMLNGNKGFEHRVVDVLGLEYLYHISYTFHDIDKWFTNTNPRVIDVVYRFLEGVQE